MIRVMTTPPNPDERYFVLRLPCHVVGEVDGPQGEVEVVLSTTAINAVGTMLTSEMEKSLSDLTPPELVEVLSVRAAACMPEIDYAIRITALASALVGMWERGIFGGHGFEVGSTFNHIQHVLAQLAEHGPGFYKKNSSSKRLGSKT